MLQNHIPPAVLAAALSACAVQPEILNSERIEQRFGSYEIEVIEQSSAVRRSNLYSTDGNVITCRTYAVVEFVDSDMTDIAETHSGVLAGESIGAMFKTAGWVIEKETFYVGEMQVANPLHPIGRLMRLDAPASLGVHAYRLLLSKKSRSIHYATIVETHHPDYLVEADLLELYPPVSEPRPTDDEIRALITLVLGVNQPN